MNKKLILLILILPLFLMLSIYTTTSRVGLKIDAPVSSIEIASNDVVYLDFDDSEKYFINYTVYPVSATNKKVVFSTEQVGDSPFATLDFIDGYIIPKSIGVAKVYLSTIDGGFKDSFIVRVDSIKVQKIESVATANELMVGQTSTITTSFIPENAINQMLTYTSSDTNVATVNDKGIITAVGKGRATITVTADGNTKAKDYITIDVYNQDILDIAQEEVYTYLKEGSVNISIDTDEEYNLTFEVFDTNGNKLTGVPIDFAKTNIEVNAQNKHLANLNYAFNNDFYGSVIFKITITTNNAIREPFTKECTITRVNEITASFDDAEIIKCTAGAPFALHNKITVTPENADIRYEVTTSNQNVTITEVSERIRLTAALPGVTEITVAVINNLPPYQKVFLTKEVVILPQSINITNSAQTYGIEDIWTIGGYEADGTKNTSKINVSLGKTDAGENFTDYFAYTTDNEKVTVLKDGTIEILDESFNGLVNITAAFGYKSATINSQNYCVRCIGNGVNIRNFDDLYTQTKQNKIIVLQTEIKEDFGFDKNGNKVYTENSVTKIDSTYDTTHYKNTGNQNDAKVKVLIEFRADVYGNGYQINAHNVAYGLDSTGSLKSNALFKGPLNFVSMSETSGSLISVKAQDNISFAVYEGVTLTNIELKSCDLQADKDGQYDLTDLNYVGTTLEVFGDDVNINYSRITNGRTVLRAFGDINDKQKVINVNIKNCVLSASREFIIRMGTNAFIDGTVENPAPYLDDNTAQAFPAQKTYESMTDEQKQVYDQKYIKTFVTIKNSVLKDAGLFCIGIDTHFSGSALADGSGLAGGLIDSWHDLAKTSYGAKLVFEGDVRMYDWKEVSQVDSSSLIEIVGESIYSGLAFDVKELISELANNTQKPYLNTIVHNQNGKQYVHGGIAFFGGGKNYGVFETQNYTFKVLNGYEIKLSDVGRVELQLAAGDEGFYFMLNDSTTQGFLPDDQAEMLQSTSAYAPIYQKD